MTRPGGLAGAVLVAALLGPASLSAHPLGNFSINHYSSLRVEADRIELRYVVDMAEIPTFQEIQDTGLVPAEGEPGVAAYVHRKADSLKENLHLELNGRRLALDGVTSEIAFPPGAGSLPTLRLGSLYRARFDATAGLQQVRYRDGNFPDRAGWKEVVATAGPGVILEASSVPATDRSGGLVEYPMSLLASPPQELEARLRFTITPPTVIARAGSSPLRSRPTASSLVTSLPPSVAPTAPTAAPETTAPPAPRTPRDAFTALVATRRLGAGVVLASLMVAAVLGAAHALEPGHGKTVVAAYLVGSRGTPWHALVLGLVVTASHTAGVYLLGGVTLYASRYVVPERLFPWLGLLSGLTIATLGLALFGRRVAGVARTASSEAHQSHHHDHPDRPGLGRSHAHGGTAHHHSHAIGGSLTLRELVALGVTGGIVPCPAALVVLLSALALRRVGFGLLLIVAFSVGLAGVLIGLGLLMVYARRVMVRLRADGPFVQRWLPLASSLVVTGLGLAIALQAVTAGGLVDIRP